MFDWDTLFKLAQESFPGIAIGAPSKKARAQESFPGMAIGPPSKARSGAPVSQIRGGNEMYPCLLCLAAGYKGYRRSSKRLQEHIVKWHDLSEEDALNLWTAWKETSSLTRGSDKAIKYEEQDKPRPFLSKKLTLDDMAAMSPEMDGIVYQMRQQILDPSPPDIFDPADYPDLPEVPTPPDPGEEEAEAIVRKYVRRKVAKKRASIKKTIQEADIAHAKQVEPKQPKAAKIEDVVNMMQKQMGVIPKEDETLHDISKKQPRANKPKKASKADSANIKKRIKATEAAQVTLKASKKGITLKGARKA